MVCSVHGHFKMDARVSHADFDGFGCKTRTCCLVSADTVAFCGERGSSQVHYRGIKEWWGLQLLHMHIPIS